VPSIEEVVLQTAGDIFTDAGPLTLASSPETTAGWDSTQHLNLVLALEQRFNVEFLPEEFDQMRSLAAIATLIQAKMS
jgi:acyl carrier protein